MRPSNATAIRSASAANTLGYVEGMSLYRGYYVPNGRDPSGEITTEFLDDGEIVLNSHDWIQSGIDLKISKRDFRGIYGITQMWSEPNATVTGTINPEKPCCCKIKVLKMAVRWRTWRPIWPNKSDEFNAFNQAHEAGHRKLDMAIQSAVAKSMSDEGEMCDTYSLLFYNTGILAKATQEKCNEFAKTVKDHIESEMHKAHDWHNTIYHAYSETQGQGAAGNAQSVAVANAIISSLVPVMDAYKAKDWK